VRSRLVDDRSSDLPTHPEARAKAAPRIAARTIFQRSHRRDWRWIELLLQPLDISGHAVDSFVQVMRLVPELLDGDFQWVEPISQLIKSFIQDGIAR